MLVLIALLVNDTSKSINLSQQLIKRKKKIIVKSNLIFDILGNNESEIFENKNEESNKY